MSFRRCAGLAAVVAALLSDPASAASSAPADAVKLFRYGRPSAAVAVLREAAEAGDLESQKLLAGVLEEGVLSRTEQPVAADPREAFKWYERAAAAGDKHSMTRLGILYVVGRGTPRDIAKALELFRGGGIDVDAYLSGKAAGTGKEMPPATAAWMIAFKTELMGRVGKYPRAAVERNESGLVTIWVNTSDRSVEIVKSDTPELLREIVRTAAAGALIHVPPPDDVAASGFRAEFQIDYRIN